MQGTLPIEPGKYYHIFNQGVSGTNLFADAKNYEYFLHLYNKYINPNFTTFAWCLMPNHFHLLIRVNDNLQKPPHQYFSNLFNAYTQAFNKWHKRRGTLFQRPFKRRLVADEKYFRTLVVYIHNNPVHHRFVSDAIEWGWSSYLSYLSNKPTKLDRATVIDWFGGKNNLEYMHQQAIDFELLKLFGELE
ncbi:MAG: transposase [Salinivirgaceae bacterium]|nr:transposase [Salinivirgaceae bacterium]